MSEQMMPEPEGPADVEGHMMAAEEDVEGNMMAADEDVEGHMMPGGGGPISF